MERVNARFIDKLTEKKDLKLKQGTEEEKKTSGDKKIETIIKEKDEDEEMID